MLERLVLQKIVLRSVNAAVLGAIISWVLLVIHGAQSLQDSTGDQAYHVQFGSLELAHLSKHTAAHSVTASFSLGDGLIYYALIWLGLSICVGLGWAVAVQKIAPNRDS